MAIRVGGASISVWLWAAPLLAQPVPPAPGDPAAAQPRPPDQAQPDETPPPEPPPQQAPPPASAPPASAPSASAATGPGWYPSAPAGAYPPGPYYSYPPPQGQTPSGDRGTATRVEKSRPGPPPAARGFQIGLRMGMDAPGGSATGELGDSMSARHSFFMASLGIDPGFKVTDEIFVGGYYTLNLGDDGRDNDRTRRACQDSDDDNRDTVSCTSNSHRFGVQGQYHFLPDKIINPWLGLGFGYEVAQQSLRDSYAPATGDTFTRRIETTRSMGWNVTVNTAFDVRLGRVFGFGPYLSFAWGWYVSSATEIDGDTTYDGEIPETATHSFVGGGVRAVFLP